MSEITSSKERNIYAKLEAIKQIRNKTIQLEKLKSRIVREVKLGDEEEKCLVEYRKEMEQLLQEKMSHVEELRLIHADINEMEAVIKKAEENKLRSMNLANRIHDEYLPLKGEIDQMRREYLGLSPLRDLHEEEGTAITKDRFKTSTAYFNAKTQQSTTPYVPQARHVAAASAAAVSLLQPEATVTTLQPSSTSHAFMPPPRPVGPLRINKDMGGTNRVPQNPSISMGHSTFRSDFNVGLRQQPPPMKSCLSCHQQIHRNAPICPLCKAKSRSRNPKKPKKKDH
ncbi:zinc finger C4H2 domain-containing protein isoform X1 [Condylostylus longicornis]|uniref:zinc finger C4H2 domain-containing protein isoform X1 n=1 Tax=Condylostylus longicornis TaxID=2530218 RepID=UPI00244D9F91|nr:zinc finger C4H2 domain-containing protein isoform X1 [Condylostylus longicornis]